MQIARIPDKSFKSMLGIAALASAMVGADVASGRRRREPNVEIGAPVDLVGITELVGDELLGADVASLIAQAKTNRGYPPGAGPASAGRMAVVQREPTRARDYPIGFDSVANIAAAASASLSATPQVVFKPQRLIIPAAIADNFVLTDIKVGKNSQLAASGNMPAAAFIAGAFDVKLNLDTCQIAMSVVLNVTNISGGASRFLAALIGPAVE